eukprot:gene4919-6001_t
MGTWECSACTFHNADSVSVCEVCEEARWEEVGAKTPSSKLGKGSPRVSRPVAVRDKMVAPGRKTNKEKQRFHGGNSDERIGLHKVVVLGTKDLDEASLTEYFQQYGDIVGSPEELCAVEMIPKKREFTLRSNLRPDPGTIAREAQVDVEFLPVGDGRVGLFRTHISFRFQGPIVVSHPVCITVADAEAVKLLKQASAEPEPSWAGVWDGLDRHLIPAFPPGRASSTHKHTAVETQWVLKLPHYPIPEEVQQDIDIADRFQAFDPWRKREHFKQRMHNLLWIEEAAQVKSMRQFDLESVALTPVLTFMEGEFLKVPPEPTHSLHVPGLAERRPSVLPGDYIIAWEAGTADVEYESAVCLLSQSAVCLLSQSAVCLLSQSASAVCPLSQFVVCLLSQSAVCPLSQSVVCLLSQSAGYVWKCLQTDVLVHFCQDFVATDRTFHVRFSFNRMQGETRCPCLGTWSPAALRSANCDSWLACRRDDPEMRPSIVTDVAQVTPQYSETHPRSSEVCTTQRESEYALREPEYALGESEYALGEPEYALGESEYALGEPAPRFPGEAMRWAELCGGFAVSSAVAEYALGEPVDLDVIWPEECPEVANEMGGIGEEAELAVTVLDEMQSAAVANILRRRVLLKQRRVTPAPLLLRGSFGCGKTRTLLE